jgi:tetratricopeptide (TPR) repeat protein
MSFLTGIKAGKAYRLQKNGSKEEAIRLYEECFAEGLNDPRYNLAYALLITRDGQYQKAKDFLVKHQKAPGMTPEQRVNLLVDYAVCCFRLGDLDKGINTLEQQFRKTETGLLFQTLGYLYVEKYDQAHRPDFAALAAEREAAEAREAEEQAESVPVSDPENPEQAPAVPAQEGEAAEKPLSPEEAWNAGVEKAEAFLQKALEYDDEDPICLDNRAQFLYRVRGDKAAAKPFFEKALSFKDNQIDTLVFLSRYDEEAGNRGAALEKLEKARDGRFSPLNYWSREQVEGEISRLKEAR